MIHFSIQITSLYTRKQQTYLLLHGGVLSCHVVTAQFFGHLLCKTIGRQVLRTS